MVLNISVSGSYVNECCSGNHAILVAILDVLSEVQELDGA